MTDSGRRLKTLGRGLPTGMLESEEFFHKRENASRQIAMRLGPIVELETTNLSPEEICNSAWSLLAPNLTGSGRLPKAM